MSKYPKFIGVVNPPSSLVVNPPIGVLTAIRRAFHLSFFNICPIDSLSGSSSIPVSISMADWVVNSHCVDFKLMPESQRDRLRMYVVNYLICPNAKSELEVRIVMDHVWPGYNKRRSRSLAWQRFLRSLIPWKRKAE